MNKFHFLVWKRKDDFCPGISWEILRHIRAPFDRKAWVTDSFCCFCCTFLNNSHLLRDSKYWNWWVNILYRIFCKFTHKFFLDFLFFYIFPKKTFTLHVFVCEEKWAQQGSQCSRKWAETLPKSKTSIWTSVNMTNSFEKKPRTKWPCVLPKQHGLSSSLDYRSCTGMEIMEQVPKFNISIIIAKKRTLFKKAVMSKYFLLFHTLSCMT